MVNFEVYIKLEKRNIKPLTDAYFYKFCRIISAYDIVLYSEILCVHSERQNTVPVGRMGHLMSLDPADLAQRVMTLSLELEEKLVLCERVQARLNETSEKLTKHKSESDSIIKRHQTFIDQVN